MIDIRKALYTFPDYLLQDELGENEISQIHEIELFWREVPLPEQECIPEMRKAVLKYHEK